MEELAALRTINFDWVMRLDSVWQDCPHDVPQFNEKIKREILLEAQKSSSELGGPNPLGYILVGGAGAGKTHTLGSIRKESKQRGLGFVLVDMTDVKDFWETVLLGYLSSIQQPYHGRENQCELLLEHLINLVDPSKGGKEILKKFARSRNSKVIEKFIGRVLERLAGNYRRHLQRHRDVIRALFLLQSGDFRISDTGYSWLQGLAIEEQDRTRFNFAALRKPPREIVEGISWALSLKSPMILALDQIDAIVAQHHIASQLDPDGDLGDDQRASRAIINGIGGGLSALIRSVTARTLVVISCLEATWKRLLQWALKSDTDSYRQPATLYTIDQGDTARRFIQLRLKEAYKKTDFQPPYPTWPFKGSAFDHLTGIFPRDLLKMCDDHRRKCLNEGRILELTNFGPAEGPGDKEPGDKKLAELDSEFERYKSKAELNKLLDEKNEDALLAPVLQAACRCLLKENPLRENVDAVVDVDFGGGRNYSPLHSRIRLIHRDQDDMEKHYSLRAIQKNHAIAFQARLKAAMTASGIDRKLSFRRLVIVRSGEPPSGAKTKALVEKFEKAGGVFVAPEPHELTALWAVYQMEKRRHPDLDEWLRLRRPVSGLKMMTAARLVKKDLKTRTDGERKPLQKVEEPEETVTQDQKPTASPKQTETGGKLPLGTRRISDSGGEIVSIERAVIAKHFVVLAGSGSGKTVLVRRLVEEAALLGIPSILVDSANDLSRMGDPWPRSPETWTSADGEKAKRYHEGTETFIWTPGREKGNPLNLEPLPDLTAVADDADELDQAVSMAREAFRGIVAPGSSITAQKKVGVLSAALHNFALAQGGDLEDFVEFLSNLPEDATAKISDAPKLAQQIADSIRAEMQTNPLLRQSGARLDPRILFGDDRRSGKTRISVINLVGLPNLTNQQQFLNQLAMTLFTWIKKNPAAGNRPIRGLFVIDEAKDFVPSIRSVPCKDSLLRLTAQARKYGLGLIFATQSPKDLDHTIITNCTTHFYGKASSPNAIQVISDQIKIRGGSGTDIPKLNTGEFYVYTEKLNAPLRVNVPLCLSYHPPNPLNETEVIDRARNSRSRIAGGYWIDAKIRRRP